MGRLDSESGVVCKSFNQRPKYFIDANALIAQLYKNPQMDDCS